MCLPVSTTKVRCDRRPAESPSARTDPLATTCSHPHGCAAALIHAHATTSRSCWRCRQYRSGSRLRSVAHHKNSVGCGRLRCTAATVRPCDSHILAELRTRARQAAKALHVLTHPHPDQSDKAVLPSTNRTQTNRDISSCTPTTRGQSSDAPALLLLCTTGNILTARLLR